MIGGNVYAMARQSKTQQAGPATMPRRLRRHVLSARDCLSAEADRVELISFEVYGMRMLAALFIARRPGHIYGMPERMMML